MNRFFSIVACFYVVAASVAVGADMIAQGEIDRIVDEEVLLCVHPDDARASIDYLKGKGATEQAIADAVARNLRENHNAPRDEEGSVKSNSAIHWLEVLGDQNQISNLLFVAQSSTNIHASSTVRAFYRRINDKREFVDAAQELLSRPGMEQLKSTVWGILEKEAEGPLRDRILALSRSKLGSGFVNFYHADIILSQWDKGYSDGAFRKRLLEEALGSQANKDAFPAAYDSLRARSVWRDKR